MHLMKHLLQEIVYYTHTHTKGWNGFYLWNVITNYFYVKLMVWTVPVNKYTHYQDKTFSSFKSEGFRNSISLWRSRICLWGIYWRWEMFVKLRNSFRTYLVQLKSKCNIVSKFNIYICIYIVKERECVCKKHCWKNSKPYWGASKKCRMGLHFFCNFSFVILAHFWAAFREAQSL